MLENIRQNKSAQSSSSAQVSASSSEASIQGPPQQHQQAFTDLKRAIAEFETEPGVEIPLPPIPSQETVVALLMKNAAVLMKAKEGRLAFNILRNVLMRQADHPQALRMMGQCLKDENRFEEALKVFRAYSKVTRTPEAAALVAEMLYLSERDDAALASYRDVLKNVISDASLLFDIYKNVGNIHTRAGDFESAEEYYDKAYTLRSESDILLVNYGTLEIQRGQWNEAVTRFRRAVEINPQSDRGWVGLAMVHREMGDLELAKANLYRALDINGANRTALRLAVDWASQDHDFGSVIGRLQTYLSTKGSEDAEMSFLLARTQVQAGHFLDARVEIERVLALDPGYESADALARALDRHLNAVPA